MPTISGQRVTLTVELNLDPLLGTFHTAESARDGVQAILNGSIPHYNPTVQLEDQNDGDDPISDALTGNI